jgi:hypothetical protein
MSDRVECRSDHAYVGYPIAFFWQESRLEVAELLSENRNPLGYSFRVRNEPFGIFELDYDISTDQWSVHQL